MRSVRGSMRTTSFGVVSTSVQMEPAAERIHTGPAKSCGPTGMTSTTRIVTGSILATEVVGSPSWSATQT